MGREPKVGKQARFGRPTEVPLQGKQRGAGERQPKQRGGHQGEAPAVAGVTLRGPAFLCGYLHHFSNLHSAFAELPRNTSSVRSSLIAPTGGSHRRPGSGSVSCRTTAVAPSPQPDERAPHGAGEDSGGGGRNRLLRSIFS